MTRKPEFYDSTYNYLTDGNSYTIPGTDIDGRYATSPTTHESVLTLDGGKATRDGDTSSFINCVEEGDYNFWSNSNGYTNLLSLNLTTSVVGEYNCIKSSKGDRFFLTKLINRTLGAEIVEFYDITNSLNCSATEQIFTAIPESQFISIIVEDNYSLMSNKSTSWSYIADIVSETYSPVAVETSVETFKFSMIYDSSDWSFVSKKLIYNEVNFTGATAGEETLWQHLH
jgi:hypothetical protein